MFIKRLFMGDISQAADNRKKTYRRIRLVVLISVIAIICIIAVKRDNNRYNIKYSFKGNDFLSVQELEAELNSKIDTNLRNITLRKIKEKLEKNPFIEKVTPVQQNAMNINIYIKEIEPQALIAGDNSELYFYCKGNKLIDYRPTASLRTFPLVSGVLDTHKIIKPAISGVISILNGMNAKEYKHLYSLLTEIQYQRNGTYKLDFDNGNFTIIFGEAKDIVNKLNKLDKYLQHRYSNTEFASTKIADLRWKGSLVIN